MPYTSLCDEAVTAVEESGHDPLRVDVSGSDDAYWGLLSGLWAKRETFVVVEHDIVIPPTAIDELVNCPGEWCGFATPYVGTLWVGLSCTKFEASLLKDFSGVLDEVATMSDVGHDQKHWCRLDAWIHSVLEREGVEQHPHRGRLGHHRDGVVRYSVGDTIMPSHGCWR